MHTTLVQIMRPYNINANYSSTDFIVFAHPVNNIPDITLCPGVTFQTNKMTIITYTMMTWEIYLATDYRIQTLFDIKPADKLEMLNYITFASIK